MKSQTYYNYSGLSYKGLNMKKGIIIILSMFLGNVCILSSAFGQSVVVIQPQEVGVVFHRFSGTLSETPLQAGTHFINPITQEVTIYSIAQQEYTMANTIDENQNPVSNAITARTSDGVNIEIEVTVIFNVNPQKAYTLYPTWGNSYTEGFVRPVVRATMRDIIAQQNAEDIYVNGHIAVEVEIEDILRPEFDEEGLQLNDFIIRSIEYDPEFVEAMENND